MIILFHHHLLSVSFCSGFILVSTVCCFFNRKNILDLILVHILALLILSCLGEQLCCLLHCVCPCCCNLLFSLSVPVVKELRSFSSSKYSIHTYHDLIQLIGSGRGTSIIGAFAHDTKRQVMTEITPFSSLDFISPWGGGGGGCKQRLSMSQEGAKDQERLQILREGWCLLANGGSRGRIASMVVARKSMISLHSRDIMRDRYTCPTRLSSSPASSTSLSWLSPGEPTPGSAMVLYSEVSIAYDHQCATFRKQMISCTCSISATLQTPLLSLDTWPSGDGVFSR